MKINRYKIDLLQAKQNMNGKQLAALIGIGSQNLSTIKTRGTCKPETVVKIANALNVDPAEILDQED